MKTRTTLSAALMATAAATMLSTAASADELSALKAQLETLQSRVNTLESAPATGLEGKSLMTFERGQGSNNWDVTPAREIANTGGADSGFTIGITPTADMPAPVAEITVYGWVKGSVIYDFDDYTGKGWNPGNIGDGGYTGDHISLWGSRSRFGIRSKIDTAIGQIRTQIEGDFWGGDGRAEVFRLRHAVGHWDMTPNWTLSAGQWWQTAALLPIGITTVDDNGQVGPAGYGWTPQVRLTYTDGPLSWAVAIENPSNDTGTNMPNFSSFLQYDIAGGHQFIVTGTLADWEGVNGGEGPGCSGDCLGWAIQAGANINLADVATLTAGMIYGEGEPSNYLNGLGPDWDAVHGNNLAEIIGFNAGLSFAMSDTTTFNVGYGYVEDLDVVQAGDQKLAHSVHANVMWQPVRQMRMGWEVMWGQREDGAGNTDDGVRAQYAAWFFF